MPSRHGGRGSAVAGAGSGVILAVWCAFRAPSFSRACGRDYSCKTLRPCIPGRVSLEQPCCASDGVGQVSDDVSDGVVFGGVLSRVQGKMLTQLSRPSARLLSGLRGRAAAALLQAKVALCVACALTHPAHACCSTLLSRKSLAFLAAGAVPLHICIAAVALVAASCL